MNDVVTAETVDTAAAETLATAAQATEAAAEDLGAELAALQAAKAEADRKVAAALDRFRPKMEEEFALVERKRQAELEDLRDRSADADLKYDDEREAVAEKYRKMGLFVPDYGGTAEPFPQAASDILKRNPLAARIFNAIKNSKNERLNTTSLVDFLGADRKKIAAAAEPLIAVGLLKHEGNAKGAFYKLPHAVAEADTAADEGDETENA